MTIYGPVEVVPKIIWTDGCKMEHIFHCWVLMWKKNKKIIFFLVRNHVYNLKSTCAPTPCSKVLVESGRWVTPYMCVSLSGHQQTNRYNEKMNFYLHPYEYNYFLKDMYGLSKWWIRSNGNTRRVKYKSFKLYIDLPITSYSYTIFRTSA